MAASSAAGCSKRGSQDASNYADLLLSTLYLYGCSYNNYFLLTDRKVPDLDGFIRGTGATMCSIAYKRLASF
jgi:hypothetical protein